MVKGLPEVFSAEITVEGSQTDAGSSPNRVAGYVIRNAYGEDVTAHFSRVETVDGTLIVNPAPITILTGSAQKAYDGLPLTCGEADVSGFIRRNPAEADQNIGFAAEDELGNGALYVLCGTVQVFGCNPLTGETELIEVRAGQRLYAALFSNSARRSIRFVLQAVTEDDLPEALLRMLAANQSILIKACGETGWDQAAIEARIQALPDGAAYRTEEKDLIIENCADMRITVDTVGTDYNGVVLTLKEISYANISTEADIRVKAVGSQTEVGESANTCEIDWGSADPGNFTVSEQLGVLKVTPCEHNQVTETVSKATCVSAGQVLRTCVLCGETATQVLPLDPSNHSGGVSILRAAAATCANEGYTGDTVCLGCGAVLSSGQATSKDPANHTGGTDTYNESAATCANEGYTGDTFCLGCGAFLSSGQYTSKNPANHTGGTDTYNESAATCANEGYTGDTYCLGCGASLSSGQYTSKNPANHVGGTVLQNQKAATCAEAGYTGDTVCLGCGALLSPGAAIPLDPNNHTGGTTVANAQAPTCMSTGYSGDVCCASCGAYLSAGSTLPVDMNNHASPVSGGAYAPTCTTTGFTGETICAACGTFIAGGTTIPELGHSWVYEAPIYRCTRCGEISKMPP